MHHIDQQVPNKLPRRKSYRFENSSSLSISSSVDEVEEISDESQSLVIPKMRNRYNLEADYGDEKYIQINQNSWLIILKKLGVLMDILSRMPLPPANVGGIAAATLILSFFGPKALVQTLIYPAYRHCIGGLYPAYASYKAVRSKNVREYVKWMMYWIVLALFSALESPADMCLAWLPFYYEVKILLILWLLSPATKGSSMLYKKFLHPALAKREQEIDEALSVARDKGYRAVLQLGSKATNALLNTAIKSSGNLMHQLRKTHSLSDIPEAPSLQGGIHNDYIDENEDFIEPRRNDRNPSITRRKSDSVRQRPLSYSEDDFERSRPHPKFSRKISEESSGYSSSASSEPKIYSRRTNKELNSGNTILEDIESYEDEDQDQYPQKHGNLLDKNNCQSYCYKNVTITDVTNIDVGFLSNAEINNDNLSLESGNVLVVSDNIDKTKKYSDDESNLRLNQDCYNKIEDINKSAKNEAKQLDDNNKKENEMDETNIVLKFGEDTSSPNFPNISDPNWSRYEKMRDDEKEVKNDSKGLELSESSESKGLSDNKDKCTVIKSEINTQSNDKNSNKEILKIENKYIEAVKEHFIFNQNIQNPEQSQIIDNNFIENFYQNILKTEKNTKNVNENLDSVEDIFYDISDNEDSLTTDNIISGNISIKITKTSDENTELNISNIDCSHRRDDNNTNVKILENTNNKKVHVIGKKRAPKPPCDKNYDVNERIIAKEEIISDQSTSSTIKASELPETDLSDDYTKYKDSMTEASTSRQVYSSDDNIKSLNTERSNSPLSCTKNENTKVSSKKKNSSLGMSKLLNLPGKVLPFWNSSKDPKDAKDSSSNSGSSQTSLRSQESEKMAKSGQNPDNQDSKSVSSFITETDV